MNSSEQSNEGRATMAEIKTADLAAEKIYSKQAGEAVEQIAKERDELKVHFANLERESTMLYQGMLAERDALQAKLAALEGSIK